MAEPGTEARIGQAGEDYLRAIFKLTDARTPTTTSALAAALGVSHPSVTSMVKKLHALQLVAHTPYRGVRLTKQGRGRALALELTRHHRLLELYLVERLGVPKEDVHEEADRLEHALSETVEGLIATSLGDPVCDPHGDPIPPGGGTP